MFLSPSPKFPPFRERSHAKDCDLPWGWARVLPLPFPLEIRCVSPSLYFVYTWVPYALLDQLTVQKKPLYPVSSQTLDFFSFFFSFWQVVLIYCVYRKRQKMIQNQSVHKSKVCVLFFNTKMKRIYIHKIVLKKDDATITSYDSVVEISTVTWYDCFNIDHSPSSGTPYISLTLRLHLC